MRKAIFLPVFLLVVFGGYSQEQTCEGSFRNDTLTMLGVGSVMEGEMLETTVKNQSVVQLFAVDRKKFYIRIYTTENFYFDKKDLLNIESGKWTYPVKNCKQYKISKTMGMYVFEVQKNYLVTLRDEGMSGYTFAGAVSEFGRSDRQQIKKMCLCFYETMFGKK